MKYVMGQNELSSKHCEVLSACSKLNRRMNIYRYYWLNRLGNDRSNPRYHRLQDRYFRAIERLAKIALYYNVSAVRDEIIMIGSIGFLTVPNWARLKFIKFTQSDKNKLAETQTHVIDSLFGLLDRMPSTICLKETRDTISKKIGFEIVALDLVRELASLCLWTEVKSGEPTYHQDFEMSDKLSIFSEILVGRSPLRRSPAPDDIVRIDSVCLRLYTNFRQSFLPTGEPSPIAIFYIFLMSPCHRD